MKNWLKSLFADKPDATVAPVEPSRPMKISVMALANSRSKGATDGLIEPYEPPEGVIPTGQRSAAMAMDSTPYDYVNQTYYGARFKGYPYLALLSQLPEYRKITETIAKEMTRKWIKLKTVGDDDKSDKIDALNTALEKWHVRDIFRQATALDGFFGRGQIFIDVKTPSGQSAQRVPGELETPLLVDPTKITKGSLLNLKLVEPIWTYPSYYNSDNPLAADYYVPQKWFVMGQTVHASRLIMFVSRPVPDILKASYNFGGLSMSQLAEPYINNWLRTRDSVSDLVHSFSVSGIMTNMGASLTGTDDKTMFDRAELFNNTRDNRGVFMLDKETEEFFQFNTPLSGLDALQAQAQEQMASVSSIPLIKLLGITPSGLNASSEGELRVFGDDTHANQENQYRDNLTKVLNILQLNEFGEIDSDITFDFEPLEEMNKEEQATIRKTDADTDAVLVSIGALSPDDVRERLIADPDNNYSALEAMPDDDDADLEGRQDMIQATAKIRDE